MALFIVASFTLLTVALLMVQERTQDRAGTIVFAIFYSFFFAAMVATTVVVTASDPSDPTVTLERLSRIAKANKVKLTYRFNATDYSFHCDICNTHVLKNTKHCQQCNRCSYEFDHHCVWVSNDIGMHNYAAFIRMLIAVLATVLTQVAHCIYTLVALDSAQSSDPENL